jgi:ABC-type proline/glycine betaine transport system ATPase subunit
MSFREASFNGRPSPVRSYRHQPSSSPTSRYRWSMPRSACRSSICSRTSADELKVSIIYITHDLATAYYISDRVLIMQRGKVVEAGPAREVLSNPRHPYTILLRESILSLDDVDNAHPDSAAREDERTATAD